MGDLAQAAYNFHEVERTRDPAVILLAERAGYDAFSLLAAELQSADRDALWYDRGPKPILIVAGRQIITKERLEILGLATRAPIPDGLPAEEVLKRLHADDALAVLPWGVGKWLGHRGQIVKTLMASAAPGRLFLGDNGGRPGWWPVPQFSGILPILAGSDPLPLAHSADAIGRFGSRIQASLDPSQPLTSLKRALRDPATRITSYGRLAPSLRFFSDQARLRFGRHRMEFA